LSKTKYEIKNKMFIEILIILAEIRQTKCSLKYSLYWQRSDRIHSNTVYAGFSMQCCTFPSDLGHWPIKISNVRLIILSRGQMSDRSMAWAFPCPIVFPLMRTIYSQFMRRGGSLLSACDCAVCATEQEFRLMPAPTALFSSLHDGSETGNCSCKSMHMRDLGLMSRL
jgi:hypothetical protein